MKTTPILLPRHIDPEAGVMDTNANILRLGKELEQTKCHLAAEHIRERIRNARALLDYYTAQVTLLSRLNRN